MQGDWVKLYADEGRWYAGATVHGWKSYATCVAEEQKIRERWGTKV